MDPESNNRSAIASPSPIEWKSGTVQTRDKKLGAGTPPSKTTASPDLQRPRPKTTINQTHASASGPGPLINKDGRPARNLARYALLASKGGYHKRPFSSPVPETKPPLRQDARRQRPSYAGGRSSATFPPLRSRDEVPVSNPPKEGDTATRTGNEDNKAPRQGSLVTSVGDSGQESVASRGGHGDIQHGACEKLEECVTRVMEKLERKDVPREMEVLRRGESLEKGAAGSSVNCPAGSGSCDPSSRQECVEKRGDYTRSWDLGRVTLIESDCNPGEPISRKQDLDSGESIHPPARKEQLLNLSSIPRQREHTSPVLKPESRPSANLLAATDTLHTYEAGVGRQLSYQEMYRLLECTDSSVSSLQEYEGEEGEERNDAAAGFSAVTNHFYPPEECGPSLLHAHDFESNRFLSHTTLIHQTKLPTQIIAAFLQEQHLLDQIPKEQILRMVEKLETLLTPEGSDSGTLSRGAILFREGERLEGTMRITNTSDHPITYRIKPPRNVNIYKVQPEMGTLNVGRSAIIKILTDYLSAPPMMKYDRFEIHSAEFETGHFSQQELMHFWQGVAPCKIQRTFAYLVLLLHPDDPVFASAEITDSEFKTLQHTTKPYPESHLWTKSCLANYTPSTAESLLYLLLEESKCVGRGAGPKGNQCSNSEDLEENLSKLALKSSSSGSGNIFFLLFSACSVATGIFLLTHSFRERLRL